jgi:purine-binding chemotaxis protein CheW
MTYSILDLVFKSGFASADEKEGQSAGIFLAKEQARMDESQLTQVAQAKPGRYLTFGLDSQQYAVPIMAVREINQLCAITPVPRTPNFILGVINLRGKIIPVADLRLKFGMSKSEFGRQTCIVVIETDSGQVGMVVDEVNDVVELQASHIEPAPQLGSRSEMQYLMGIGKFQERVLILIDIHAALSSRELLNQVAGLTSSLSSAA